MADSKKNTQTAVAIPAGYALVPIEPTQAMMDAWNDSDADDFKIPYRELSEFTEEQWADWVRKNARKDWQAMLYAAPQPAQADARVGLTDEQREAIDFVIGWYEQSTIADNPYREHIAALRALLQGANQ